MPLPLEEVRHLLHARRLSDGDPIALFNGAGAEWVGYVEIDAGRRSATVQIASRKTACKLTPEIHLSVAVPKGERQDWLIQKAAELGVASITPLISERSVAMPTKRWDAKRKRWRRVAIEACKQSQASFVPEIHDPTPLRDYLAGRKKERRLWVCHPSGAAPAVSDLWFSSKTAAVEAMIGPEGGFTDQEVDFALAHGADCIGLGEQLLRTETAAIAVLAAVRLGAIWTK